MSPKFSKIQNILEFSNFVKSLDFVESKITFVKDATYSRIDYVF